MDKKTILDLPLNEEGKLDNERFLELIKNKIEEKNDDDDFIDSEYVSEEDLEKYDKAYNLNLATFELDSIDEFGEVQGTKIPLRKIDHELKSKYEKFDNMRKLGNRYNAYNSWDWYNDIREDFYQQAKYMIDFVDDWDKVVPFIYRPSLKIMDNDQLRTYFSFRTNFRNQIYNQIPYNYLVILINELINNLGTNSFMDGVLKLLNIWKNYRSSYSILDREMPSRIKDFYICYSNGEKYLDIINEFPIKISNDISIITEIRNSNFENKLEFFNKISSYKIMNSSFYTEERHKMISDCLNHVLIKLKPEFKSHKIDMNKLIVSLSKSEYWQPFVNDLYYYPRIKDERTIEISEIEQYKFSRNIWTKEEYFYLYNNGFIGYTLKMIEARMRSIFKFKYKLNPNPINMLNGKFYGSRRSYSFICSKQFKDTVVDAINEYFIMNYAQYAKPIKKNVEVTFDSTKFDKIRKISNKIQEKLVVEDEVELTEEIFEENSFDDDIEYEEDMNKYTSLEIQFLKCILQKEPINELNQLALVNNTLLEVIVDEINEKAIEDLNDSLIEISDEIHIYEDYLGYVEKIIKEESK